jgi:hypothetical protein
VEKQTCSKCGGDCKLGVDLETGISASLHDRFMALSSMDCTVTCLDCGQERHGRIHDMDINLDTGRLEFGRIELEDD